VASADKVLSLFEPHTRAIPRHKGGAEVEFGRHIILDQVEGGIVTRYALLEQPHEHGQAVEAVQHHRQVFGQPPRRARRRSGRAFRRVRAGAHPSGGQAGLHPAAGKLSPERQAPEHRRGFKRGYRWRVGIEGRIASLRRDYGWRKSAYHWPDGMERWLGLGVMASNVRRIALVKHH
jgi:IS5 family transposase